MNDYRFKNMLYSAQNFIKRIRDTVQRGYRSLCSPGIDSESCISNGNLRTPSLAADSDHDSNRHAPSSGPDGTPSSFMPAFGSGGISGSFPHSSASGGGSNRPPRKRFAWVRPLLIGLGVTAAILFFTFFLVIWRLIATAPDISSVDVSPSGSATWICDANGNELRRLSLSESNRDLVSIEEIPDTLQKAIIAIEDSRFYEHSGIDLRGIARAFWRGITSGSFSEGASTITQQLIKNNVFTDWTQEDSFADRFARKVQEQYLAVQLEKQLSKEEILEDYLNTINFGAGCYGVEAAAQRYFGKDVSALTLSESAVLAAIPQNPTGYNPIEYPENNQTRQRLVLQYMEEQGYITHKERLEALEDDVYLRIRTYNEAYTADADNVYSYYEDALIEQVIELLQSELNYTYEQASRALYSGGLRIYSAQDAALQEICDEEFQNAANYPEGTQYGIDYALSVNEADGSVTGYGSEALRAWVRENYDSTFDLLCETQEEAQSYADAFREYVLSLPAPTSDVTAEDDAGSVANNASAGLGSSGSALTTDTVLPASVPVLSNSTLVSPVASGADDTGAVLASILTSANDDVIPSSGAVLSDDAAALAAAFLSGNATLFVSAADDDTADDTTNDAANDTAVTRTVLSERLTLTPQPQASLVLIEQSTGLVRAIVGGRGEKTASLTLNRATDTTRQPGSTFKILTAYAPALDADGQTLATLYENEPYEYEDGTAVSNWDITDYSGTVTIREAITRSINVVAVRCITEITPRLGFTYAQRFGISTLVDSLNNDLNNDSLSNNMSDNDRFDNSGSDSASLSGVTDVIQPLALGGITNGVTNLELCAAYAAIANEGVYNRPLFFTKVLDLDGNVLLCASDSYLSAVEQSATAQSVTAQSAVEQSATVFNVLAESADTAEVSAGKDSNLSEVSALASGSSLNNSSLSGSALSASTRVLQESTAFLLTSAMEDVVSSEDGTAYGTISAAGQPVAGKTGTTSAYKDIWFVGYTPYYTCSVWGGYDNNQPLPDTSTGHTYSRLLWTAVMERVHADLPIGSFTQPDSIKKVTLCSESHLLAQENICPDVYTEFFAEGTEPTEACAIHEAETETESETIYIYQDLLDELLPETETETETEYLAESQEDTASDSIDAATSESEIVPDSDPEDETTAESGNEPLPDNQGETLPGDGDETLPDSENDNLSDSGTESRQDNDRETSPMGGENQINITAEPEPVEETSSLDDLLSRLIGQGLSLP